MSVKTTHFKHYRRHLPDTPDIQADAPMSEAGRKLLAFQFNKLCQCEARLRKGGDATAIHDMRVTSRRLRSLIALFTPFYRDGTLVPFQKTIRLLAHRLGDIRDVEVMQAQVEAYLTTQPGVTPKGLDELKMLWTAQLERDNAALIDWLQGDHYGEFTVGFAQFLLEPGRDARKPRHGLSQPTLVRQVAPPAIYAQFAIVRAYEPVLATSPLPRLHALRIEAKRLRYTLEAFQEVLAPDAKIAIEAAIALQDQLGALHDADVTIHLITQIIEVDRQTHQAGKSVKALLAYKASVIADKKRLWAGVPEAWAAFIDPAVRQAIATSVAVL